MQRQVEFADAVVEFVALQPQASGRCIALCTDVVTEHDLDQRVVGQRSLRVDLFHKQFERNLLVFQIGKNMTVLRTQEIGERWISRDVRAHYQVVEEATDKRLNRSFAAIGICRPYQHVLTIAPLLQQEREQRMQQHEGRDRQFRAQRADAGMQVGRDELQVIAARVPLHRGTRKIQRNGMQRGCVGQAIAPVVQQRFHSRTGKLVALPGGVIHVLDGIVRQWARSAS
ncbi:hypothetical protein NB696_004022 [Xanthomonas sacchari]|nr:hypothetical protein [Xanthomonas sacchari]MCW0447150.1 hypothetical protein [Xanthomonas sacchari]MCW0466770.1 hypothetical protein [Xanthomonas sacchari]